MNRDEFGVWEIVLPPKEGGAPAIRHDTKLKVRVIFSAFNT